MQKCMPRRSKSFGETSGPPGVSEHGDEFYFTPELRLRDGRIIRDLDDGVSLLASRRLDLESTSATKFCTG
jgi:hypothetical protein